MVPIEFKILPGDPYGPFESTSLLRGQLPELLFFSEVKREGSSFKNGEPGISW